MLAAMSTIILATEAAVDFAGDDLQTLAYVLLGIVLVVTLIAATVVTPGREDHDH
jgi:hypothetical protein